MLSFRLSHAAYPFFAARSRLSVRQGWVSQFPRGGSSTSSTDYASQCEAVKSSILARCQKEVSVPPIWPFRIYKSI